MAATLQFYNTAKLLFANGSLNLSSDDIRAVPMTNTYTFSASHQYASSLTNEVTSNGGTRVALAGLSWTQSAGVATFDCSDITFSASGGALTIRKIALVRYTGATSDADRPLIALITFDADATAGDGTTLKLLTPSGLWTLA